MLCRFSLLQIVVSRTQPLPCRRLGLLVFGLFLFIGRPAHGQEPGPADRPTAGVEWTEVVLLTFKAGSNRKASGITDRCFRRAHGNSETPVPHVIEIPKGPWDVMFVYVLEEAPVEMRWKTPADLTKLRRCFTGVYGEDAAQWDAYRRLIARSTSVRGFAGRQGREITKNEP